MDSRKQQSGIQGERFYKETHFNTVIISDTTLMYTLPIKYLVQH